MKKYAEGDTLTIGVWREKKEMTVTVVASVFPESLALDLASRRLGITVEKLTPRSRQKYRSAMEKGVLISKVDPNAFLGKIGVEPGDVIRQIDEISIDDIDDYKKAIVEYRMKNSIVLLLFRGGQGYYITVKMAG
jgi:serine protease Do